MNTATFSNLSFNNNQGSIRRFDRAYVKGTITLNNVNASGNNAAHP